MLSTFIKFKHWRYWNDNSEELTCLQKMYDKQHVPLILDAKSALRITPPQAKTHFFQKAGENKIITVKSSKRPHSIRNDKYHLPKSGK